MKFINFAILLLITSGCNNPKEKTNNLEQKLKPVAMKTNGMDSVKNTLKDTIPDFDKIKYAIEEKGIKPTISALLTFKPVPVEPPYTISCFDPNLRVNDGIELINSGVENTQMYVVERKKVNYQHNKLDQTDTIWIKEKLLKTDWKLIDSLQTIIGNQTKIILKMQKENRICTIEKQLYQAEKNNNNFVEEWFEVRTVK